jgi:hypothetical protein
LNYYSTDAEIVDVTEHIANLFEPKKSMKEMISDMQSNAPVPIKDAFLIED